MARGDFKTKRKAGPGRPPGLKNKVPTEAKKYVVHVFETLQKNPKTSLLSIAKQKPDWFYDSIWKVLIPKQVNTDLSLGVSIGVMEIAVQAMRKVTQSTLPAQPPAGPPQVGGVATGTPGLLTDGEE